MVVELVFAGFGDACPGSASLVYCKPMASILANEPFAEGGADGFISVPESAAASCTEEGPSARSEVCKWWRQPKTTDIGADTVGAGVVLLPRGQPVRKRLSRRGGTESAGRGNEVGEVSVYISRKKCRSRLSD
jgi:hypothetical protein